MRGVEGVRGQEQERNYKQCSLLLLALDVGQEPHQHLSELTLGHSLLYRSSVGVKTPLVTLGLPSVYRVVSHYLVLSGDGWRTVTLQRGNLRFM